MKKKGFTLVELLAVIAILAILAIISVPSIMNLFNQAKHNSFENELKEIFKTSQEEWMKDSMFNTQNVVYARNKSSKCTKELLLSGREEIQYYIEVDKAGKIIKYFATDGTYQYEYNGTGLKIEEIGNSEQVANLESENILSLTCRGAFKNGSDVTNAETSEVCNITSGTVWNFNYEKIEKEFEIPCTGKYKLEVWGAQGGTAYAGSTYHGGYGGYSIGEVDQVKGKMLYINVGGEGHSNSSAGAIGSVIEGGHNGGGDIPVWDCCWAHYPTAGGGATHIALSSGLLNEFEDKQNDLLIVAGGGGGGFGHSYGSSYSYNGGSGGGYISERTSWGEPASQESGYSFGVGGTEDNARSTGGGGFYGGTTYTGGSGYIGNNLLKNKSMYCYNCTESNDLNTKTIKVEETSEEAISNTAKKGNGHARITYLGNN